MNIDIVGRTGFLFGLAAAGIASAFAAEPRIIYGTEWQDLSRMSLGREPTRASFAPFADERSALEILPWKTDRQICLDSETEWRFKWAKDPSSRPAGFEKPEYDVSSWETIKVPCSWQAFGANGKGGWGTALYTNARYPFKNNPPYVMDEPPKDFTNHDARNPVGSYRRDFEVPAAWKGDRLFLKFDGVDSFYYLWVNGRYVGFTKDSRCAAEFDVTDFVNAGKNTVALEVYRYSDGSYLEDQDMFRLSGIFRSTWLVRRPQTYIRDFFARARPAKDRDFAGDWNLTVESELGGLSNGNQVNVSLFDMNGTRIELAATGKPNEYLVRSPRLWSHESPNCYKLVLSLHTPSPLRGTPPVSGGEYNGSPSKIEGVGGSMTLESVSTLFGFRVSEIRNGRYELNGQKVKLCGANRHETDPMYGHYCPRSRQEQDVMLLKRANCTLVRNSHYPQDDYWYYLCDLNGIALMDEANVETHGMGYGKGASSHDPRFLFATVWRNMNMVERNKNHPSVLFWSHGNESGPGENFKAADDAVHDRDRSRPTHYERDWAASDIDSNMYPSVGRVQHRAADAKCKRPYFLCEYAHNMMNAMGNLKDYQDAFESSDVIIGGCIWDWVDQGLYKLNESGKMIIAYGGDFGDVPTDGQFVMNGCILSDRALEPAYWEIKHVFQPVSVQAPGRAACPQAAARRVEDNAPYQAIIRNKQFFRGLDRFDAKETVLVNGKAVSSQMIDVSDVGPRGEKTLALPAAALAANTPGNSVSVRYEFLAKESEGYIAKGYVVANDQIDLPNATVGRAVGEASRPGEPPTVRTSSTHRIFTAGDVTLAFDSATGALASYKVKGEERLLAPMSLDAYRAPSSNELNPAKQWSASGWRVFRQSAISFGKVEQDGDALAFTVEAECRGAAKEDLVNYDRTGGHIDAKGEPSRVMAPYFRVVQRWRILPGGAATCQSEIRPVGLVKRELPRIGYRFTFPLAFANVEWFGRGPFENYRDRKSGAFRGLWRTNLADFVMPYARPEDANNFEDTDAVTLSGPKGALGFATLGAPFAFAAIPYSPAEIIAASHPPELPPITKVEFGIFAETRGLGGASCGPGPLRRDIIDTAKSYRLDFAILPFPASTALSAKPFDFPPAPASAASLFARHRAAGASSDEKSENEGMENAFDGDVSTIWHSRWKKAAPGYPHHVICDYGKAIELSGIVAVQRQDKPNGRVRRYRVELSDDATNWHKVKEGELPKSDDLVEVSFGKTHRARYLRFTALSPRDASHRWAAMAEIQPLPAR